MDDALSVADFENDVSGIIPLENIKQELASHGLYEEGAMTRRKMKLMKEDKVCRVCGDRALGYNFDAITCESCKAFFRRNASRDQVMKCLFDGQCEVTVKTRRFCPSCRLVKCINIGMKRDMILDEIERKARMAKVIENRDKRKPKVKYECIDLDLTENSDLIGSEMPYSPPTTSTGSPLEGTCSSVTASMLGNDPSAVSVVTPPGLEPLQAPVMTNKVQYMPDFQRITKHILPSDPSLYRAMPPEDMILLNDLKVTYETTLGKLNCGSDLQDDSNYNTKSQLVNNSEIAVRRLIKYVKKFDDFKLLSQEDQITGLKACVLNTLLLRSVAFYNVENDAWLTPNGEIKSEILKKATGYDGLHDAHVSYCTSLKLLVGDNQLTMSLLQMIVLFNPDGQGIINRTLVSDLQDKYLRLLKHYLESEFSYLYATEVYAQILLRIAELKMLGEQHAAVLLQVNPMDIEPLMLEVLNLK